MAGLSFLLRSFSEEDTPAAKKKEEISLTGALQRKRLKLSRAKGPREASLNFSPYNVGYGFCMRERVAQLAGYHKILIKPPTPKEQLIFDVGKHYHTLIQKYFWKCNMLEGMWRCNKCEKPTWWARSPDKCKDCGAPSYHLEYREVFLSNEHYRMVGRSDGILYLEVNKKEERHLVDIKSISNKGAQQNHLDPRVFFEDLDEQGPIQHHVIQLMCYQYMSDIHDGHLLYVGKNGHQMKSFHIQYNESVLSPYLESIQEAIQWANDLKYARRPDLPAPCDRKKCECEKIITRKVVHDT